MADINTLNPMLAAAFRQGIQRQMGPLGQRQQQEMAPQGETDEEKKQRIRINL